MNSEIYIYDRQWKSATQIVINLILMNDHMSVSMDNSSSSETLYFLSHFVKYIFK